MMILRFLDCKRSGGMMIVKPHVNQISKRLRPKKNKDSDRDKKSVDYAGIWPKAPCR